MTREADGVATIKLVTWPGFQKQMAPAKFAVLGQCAHSCADSTEGSGVGSHTANEFCQLSRAGEYPRQAGCCGKQLKDTDGSGGGQRRSLLSPQLGN